QPAPPSESAILQSGWFSSTPEKMRSPSALIEFTPHSAMPTDGVVSGDGFNRPDDVPMCIESGNPVSVAAANTGSQWPLGNDGSPIGYGFSTKLIAFEPFAAQRSISRTARCGSHSGISVCGMKRSGYDGHHSSSIQLFHASTHASARSLSTASRNRLPPKRGNLGNSSSAHTPSSSIV